jgi:hypothetical protein
MKFAVLLAIQAVQIKSFVQPLFEIYNYIHFPLLPYNSAAIFTDELGSYSTIPGKFISLLSVVFFKCCGIIILYYKIIGWS